MEHRDHRARRRSRRPCAASRRRPAAPGAAAAATPVSPPVVEYRSRCRSTRRRRSSTAQERLIWRNPSGDTVSRAAVPPLPERLQEQPLDLHARVGRAAARRRGGHEARATGAGSTSPSMKTGGRRGPAAAAPLRPARRQRPERRDGARRPAARRPSRRTARSPSTSPSGPSCRRSSPAPASCATTSSSASGIPKIGVYEPAGMRERKTGGWNCHAFHAQLRVLRRLRRASTSRMTVPSPLRRRRDGQARLRDDEGRQHDLPLRPGRRPRLRLDRRPALPRHRVHASTRPATSRPAGAPGPRRSSA